MRRFYIRKAVNYVTYCLPLEYLLFCYEFYKRLSVNSHCAQIVFNNELWNRLHMILKDNRSNHSWFFPDFMPSCCVRKRQSLRNQEFTKLRYRDVTKLPHLTYIVGKLLGDFRIIIIYNILKLLVPLKYINK